MSAYDAIVVGTGGVGSAALYHLACRGLKVLGLDRFPPAHDRGSSHGQTRIIRQAYFEHPDYVPLLQEAVPLWRALEQETERSLYHEVGLLEIGPPDGVVIPGVLQAARQHHLAVDQLDRSSFAERFPAMTFPRDCQAVFEQQAGYLLVESCVSAHLDAARRRGAELRSDVQVHAWEAEADSIRLQTSEGRFTAARLVVTAGAWARDLLADLHVPLRVVRQHLHWLDNNDPRYHRGRCPTFFYETPTGYFYGFPQIDERGVKVAEHGGGETVEQPLQLDRSPDARDQRRVLEFVNSCLPGVTSTFLSHTVCMYTMTPDEHFIVDRHPDQNAVVLAAGLSGHGFKFSGVLGATLADLAVEGRTSRPIEFLGLHRAGLRPPID